MNGYFEEMNKNKYLKLVPTNESKGKFKKNEELLSKIRDLIRSITKNSHNYDGKCMKIKFDSDDDLPLNEKIEIYDVAVVVRAVFYENDEYYAHVFLDKYLYKLKTQAQKPKSYDKETKI